MPTDFQPISPHVPALPEGLTSRSFTTPEVDAEIPREARAFWRAVELGFFDRWLSDEYLDTLIKSYARDRMRQYGIYFDDTVNSVLSAATESLGWDLQMPVGTWVDFVKTVNAGGPEPLQASLMTAVTVHASLRRRGILRHMVSQGLQHAIDRELPIAALTASEGSIYGRFGFGPATRKQKVSANVGHQMGSLLNMRAAPVGKVLPMNPTTTSDMMERLWDQFHRSTRGSVDRQDAYRQMLSARWAQGDLMSWDRKLRAAAHIREDGSVGGAAWFTPPSWEEDVQTLKVRDLITADPVSERELWRYLAEQDLVQRVEWDSAPLKSALPHALHNPRSYEVTGVHDHLWLRILDPVNCLQGRQYAADGEFHLQLSDPMGICAGTFKITVTHGVAQVEPGVSGRDGAVFQLDVATLASVFLGDVSVLTMAEAGRITAGADVDWADFSRIWDLPTPPHNVTSF